MDVAGLDFKSLSDVLDESDYARLAFKSRFKVGILAVALGATTRQLERYFKARFGSAPHQFCQRVRLHKARELLMAGEPVKAVAYAVGFKQPSQLSKAFTQFYGYPPTRERLKNQSVSTVQLRSGYPK
jgi:transcriptional regulator GlxA family with amidase domain